MNHSQIVAQELGKFHESKLYQYILVAGFTKEADEAVELIALTAARAAEQAGDVEDKESKGDIDVGPVNIPDIETESWNAANAERRRRMREHFSK